MLKDYNYDKIANSVLLSLLELNSDLNIYDKDLFIEYIKYPLASRSIYNLSDDIKEKINKNEEEEENFLDYLRTDKYKEENIIRKYLKHFYLREKIAFEEFSKYFEEKYIKYFYAKMQFYLGNDEYTKNKMLETYEINDLMKETKLIICEYNKKSFNINEDVILNLE